MRIIPNYTGNAFRVKAVDANGADRPFSAYIWTLTVAAVYARDMQFQKIFPLLATLLLVIPAFPASAEEGPVIAVLYYSKGWFMPRAKIRLQRGTITSPLAGTAHAHWMLLPGDSLRQSSPPVERLIQFYNIKGNNVRVLCTVIVKYTRTGDSWQPAFAMVQQPEVGGGDEKSSMLSDEGMARTHVQVLAAGPADSDGLHASLVFGDGEGPVSIDAWEVE